MPRSRPHASPRTHLPARAGGLRHARTSAAALALCLAVSCAPTQPRVASPPASAPTSATATAPPPRLVVLLVIDQWPQWAFRAKRTALPHGFARLLREGTWHTGVHPSAASLTAPGHALLGTGRPPAQSGIPANEWWHRDVERVIRSTEGLDGALFAGWLRVPGLGDALVAAHPRAKAVAISLKERAAMLPLGHTGLPIWYNRRAVAWTSPAPPAWLVAYNRASPISTHLRDIWTPLDPAALPTLARVPDDAPGEQGEMGLGRTFPHALAATRDPADAIHATPLGNQLVFDVATAALAHEQLGADATPDLLILSLSAHDYAGHGWGHDSWELWDLSLRLDRTLDAFLTALDARIGRGRWAMVVTSDHGAPPLPEIAGRGGRLTYQDLADAANRAAATELGPSPAVAWIKYPTLYLTAAARAHPNLRRGITKIIDALRAIPGIERVERTADLIGDCTTRPADIIPLCLALSPDRSGDILFLPAANWILERRDDPVGVTHGSMHAYDREVPVILLAPGRTTRSAATAPHPTPFPLERVAPLIADWLGVPSPTSLPAR